MMFVAVTNIPKLNSSLNAPLSHMNFGYQPLARKYGGIAKSIMAMELKASDHTPAPKYANTNEMVPAAMVAMLSIRAMVLKSIFLVNWALFTRLMGLSNMPILITGINDNNIGSP